MKSIKDFCQTIFWFSAIKDKSFLLQHFHSAPIMAQWSRLIAAIEAAVWTSPQMHQIEKLDANVLPNSRSQIRQVFAEMYEIWFESNFVPPIRR